MKEINIRQIKENAVKLINDDWALLSAGNENGWNTMTVSWGGLGELWNKDVVFVFVRPQRYTKEFIDKNGKFTLSFFEGKMKKEMGVLGSKSGRDCDKASLAGVEAKFVDDTVYIDNAKYVLVCETLYTDHIDPDGFIDKSLNDINYVQNDHHKVYVAEIKKVLMKD